jgi:hypothetical protein
MAQPSKKKMTTKPKPKVITKLGTAGRKADPIKDNEDYYKDLQKSGFIKITKSGSLNEKKGYVGPKFTVTPKGNKYLKDTNNAYSKDPMKLRPKSKPMTKKKMGA